MQIVKVGQLVMVCMVALGAWAAPGGVQNHTVGNISIGLSDGAWTVSLGKSGGLVFDLAVAADGGHCTVLVDVGGNGTGDAMTDFGARWKALVGPLTAIPASERHANAAGFVSVFGERAGRSASGVYRTLALLSITKGQRTQSVAAMANDVRCLGPLKALVKTVAVVANVGDGRAAASNGGASTAQPASNAGEVAALLGLWHGIKTTALLTYSSSATVARYLLFFADGTYIAALPDHGIDAAAIAALSKYERGNYRVANGVVSLYQAAPGNGTPQTFDIEKGMLKDAYGYLMHRASTDGVKMDGSYGFVPSEARRLGISSEVALDFSEGNRFSDHGALDWIARLKDSTSPRRAGGDGRYEAAGFTMTFRYDDGRVVRWTLYFAGPSGISLGDVRLDKRP